MRAVFLGLKWKRQLYDTDVALRTAQDTIGSLQAFNAVLLTALAGSSPGASRTETLAKLQLKGRQEAEGVKEIQASVAATLATNNSLIEKAKTPVVASDPPSPAYCYQEDSLQSGPQRYAVHCHATKSRCELARGPNSRTKQSTCAQVTLSGVDWRPIHPGLMGSWYEFRSDPFGSPFSTSVAIFEQ